ncbi:hypothetical protein [Ilumatobacter nonamiensis]|uniref:hypothetical protein n=1 Tax=Ilumatobacter nonamiensis TaxID=467093 RepID=UPI00034A9601|nr:hypothetical protein [Ilumatobacter nonamiensis]
MSAKTDGRGRAFTVVLPALIVVASVVFAVWLFLPDDAEPQVDVDAQGPRFELPEQLVEASDLIVVGVVARVDDGRVLTDPGDPEAGIRTQLATVEVDAPLVGDVDDPLVVEQEAELLDGTRVTVNGVAPLAPGDRGLMFLVSGDSDEFPYTAFVNEQAWVPITDDRLDPIDPEDPIWREFVGMRTNEFLAGPADDN